MEITIGWWIIPTIITVVGYIFMDHSTKGASGIGGAVDAFVAGAMWLALTLFVWMVYFAYLAFTR